MSELEWEMVRRSKEARRDELAALPFVEKMRRLEALRDRMRELQASRPPKASTLESVAYAQVSALMATANGNLSVGFFGASPALVAAMATSQGSPVKTELPRVGK
jgi:hypothetical protein